MPLVPFTRCWECLVTPWVECVQLFGCRLLGACTDITKKDELFRMSKIKRTVVREPELKTREDPLLSLEMK